MQEIEMLIIYDSLTGNTEKMAHAVAEGVREKGYVTVTMRRAEETTLEDLCGASGIITGSPTYYGQMSSKVKALLDESANIHGRLSGKVGAAFTSAGGTATGAETTLLSILQAMLVHIMVIQGRADDKHHGAAWVGAPDEKAEKLCRELGNRITELTALVTR